MIMKCKKMMIMCQWKIHHGRVSVVVVAQVDTVVVGAQSCDQWWWW